MSDNKLKIARDMIKLLTEALERPLTEENHIDKLELIKDAKIVYAELGK